MKHGIVIPKRFFFRFVTGWRCMISTPYNQRPGWVSEILTIITKTHNEYLKNGFFINYNQNISFVLDVEKGNFWQERMWRDSYFELFKNFFNHYCSRSKIFEAINDKQDYTNSSECSFTHYYRLVSVYQTTLFKFWEMNLKKIAEWFATAQAVQKINQKI